MGDCGATEPKFLTGKAWERSHTTSPMEGPPVVGVLDQTRLGQAGAAKGQPRREPRRWAPQSVHRPPQLAPRASRARAPEGQRRWGRRRRGGGGSRAAAPAPVGEERRRLELLWRRTRSGGRDPPLSTWTVAKASADAFTPGRGGRTAVAAAAAAEGARGRGAPDGSGDLAALRGGCGHFTARDEGRRVCVVAFYLSSSGPAAGGSFAGGLSGRWMGSRGPRGSGLGKRRRRRRRSHCPGGA